MSARKDPFQKDRFRVEIAGVAQASFCEVILPESASIVIEHKEGTSIVTQKQPGTTTFNPLVLKWGMTNSMELYNWRKMIEQGKISSMRRNIAVTLLDEEGKDAARWEFTEAWPSKYKGPDLNAKANEVAIETLEIVFETMQRVK
ncbi:MAG: phage tail protein [Candidatus Bathyarchaeia archaeon]|jgi:phage tail-like protein